MTRCLIAVLGLAMLVGACGGGARPAVTPKAGVSRPDPTTPPPASATTPPDLGEAKSLTNLDGWLQTDIDSLEDLRGKVVVVEFWTFGCINCKHTLPYLEQLYADHEGDDFEMVGVHSPEFEYEKDPEAVSAAARDLGVTWPIALDTDKTNFFAWQGSPAYWPRIYVLDQNGHIRFDHVGEGGYERLADTVATLLE